MRRSLLIALLLVTGPCFAQVSQIERYKLKNGLEVYFMQMGELPVTSVSLFVNTGRKNEIPGQQYLSALTCNVLKLGNASYNRVDQDNLLSEMGTSVSASANNNFSRIETQFLNRDAERGFALFSSIVLKPTFPEDEIKDQVKQVLDFNNLGKMDITGLASMYSDYFVFGPAHPLGRHFFPAQLGKLSAADVKEFYKFNYTPKNCRLVIAGKPDKEKMKALIESYFGTWSAEYGEVNGVAYDIPAIGKKEYAFVNKPGATQAALNWAKKAPAADSKDLLPFMLANSAFSKILFDEIRVKEGKTYGIYSNFSLSGNSQVFNVATQVRSEVCFATTESFDRVLKEFFEKGITEDQLSMAKTEFKSQYTSLETPQEITSFFNPILFPDPNKRLNYLDEVAGINLATVNKAIKKYFSADRYKLVISGDETELKAQLTKIPGLARLGPANIEAAIAEQDIK